MSAQNKRPLEVDASLILEGSRKRRRPDGIEGSPEGESKPQLRPVLVDPSDRAGLDDVARKAMYIYDRLVAYVNPEGYVAYLPFVNLPSKREYPDYYEIIKRPITFSEIKKKLDKREYLGVSQVADDFKHCFVNAKRYNAPGSPIFVDAKHLHVRVTIVVSELPSLDVTEQKLLKESYNAVAGQTIADDDDDDVTKPAIPPPSRESSVPIATVQPGQKRGPTLKPWLVKKYQELVQHKDANGRPYAEGFMKLPSQADYPEYYQIITHPMALETVNHKIGKRYYPSVKAFVDDVSVIFANAEYFNEESSRIWKDARIMKNHFEEIMKEKQPDFVPARKYAKKQKLDAENKVQSTPSATGLAFARHGSEAPDSPLYHEDDSGDDDDASVTHGSSAAPLGQSLDLLSVDAFGQRSRSNTPHVLGPFSVASSSSSRPATGLPGANGSSSRLGTPNSVRRGLHKNPPGDRAIVKLPSEVDTVCNALENFVYSLKSQLTDDKGLGGKLDKDDKKTINDEIKKAQDWVEEFGSTATAEDFEEKREELQAVVSPLTSKIYADGSNSDDYSPPHDDL